MNETCCSWVHWIGLLHLPYPISTSSVAINATALVQSILAIVLLRMFKSRAIWEKIRTVDCCCFNLGSLSRRITFSAVCSTCSSVWRMKYPTKYCQSHRTLLWIWIMLSMPCEPFCQHNSHNTLTHTEVICPLLVKCNRNSKLSEHIAFGHDEANTLVVQC